MYLPKIPAEYLGGAHRSLLSTYCLPWPLGTVRYLHRRCVYSVEAFGRYFGHFAPGPDTVPTSYMMGQDKSQLPRSEAQGSSISRATRIDYKHYSHVDDYPRLYRSLLILGLLPKRHTAPHAPPHAPHAPRLLTILVALARQSR